MLELKLTVEGLEKERDFYFGKLRDVEVLCQENDSVEGEAVRKVGTAEILMSLQPDGVNLPFLVHFHFPSP